MSIEQENQSYVLLVVHCPDEGWQTGVVSYEAAMTVWATCSEDPSTWDELGSFWPRYRSEFSGEFASGLSISPVSESTANEQLNAESDWIVVDLANRRIFTAGDIQEIGRDAVLAIDEEGGGGHRVLLPFHLPAWWFLEEQVAVKDVFAPREQSLPIPWTDRELLFGDPLVEFIAARVGEIDARTLRALFGNHDRSRKSREQRDRDDREVRQESYSIVAAIHRDWLMTPLEAVSAARHGATKPRDLLHGAVDWIEALTTGQRRRFESGSPMVAAPDDSANFARSPMGRDEIVMYFDYCREVIRNGCRAAALGEDSESQKHAMRHAGRQWLESPLEGESPPRFTIECSRRRVPMGSGIAIVGMDEMAAENHATNCDCPICDMLASGMFGPCFTELDGYHLELDGEFAFSLHASREDWEADQAEWQEINEPTSCPTAACHADGDESDDAWRSVWSEGHSEGPLPGDSSGHMALAFRLSEINSDIQRDSGHGEAPETKALLHELNRSFSIYREAALDERAGARRKLDQQLERFVERQPSLRPKVSDFFSRLDENERVSGREIP